MEFRILGPLEVLDDGRPIDVGAAKQRALLAVLLLNANRVVASDQLIEALWGERAPGTAQKALQVYVSQLRKALGRDRILTRAPGYELRVELGELDLERFESLVAEGQLVEALRLSRGKPLADFTYEPFAQTDIARLEELVLSCLERRIDGDLAAGRHASLVGELEALVKEHPLRERLRAQLMLALYRSGRQAEALATYQQCRNLLSDELGLEPGAELKRLQRAILAQDASLALPEEPPAVEPTTSPDDEALTSQARIGTRASRKTVTVFACDVTAAGSPLDPEALQQMTLLGFEELQPVLERHGATVDRSVGGAVTAIFGIPAVHEDDALRAARAAIEIRDRIARLRDELESRWGAWLELRGGISTGEVVVGGGGNGPQATGEPMQLALRLQQSAPPQELRMDTRTYRLVRDAVRVESRDELILLLDVLEVPAGHGSRFDSPMVGRERERRRLEDAFEQAVVGHSCQLFTILGAAGVGKSRLVQEFVNDQAGRALIARGRCLPYGEGITYWPVLEAVRDAAGLEDTDSTEESLSKLTIGLAEGEEAALAAQRVAEVIGLSDELSGTEESFWGVRTFFEALARGRPLVIVFDDIHWGEATFLDLVDYISDWSRDASILLICVARPELLDQRPQWGGGKLNATSVLLEPLSEAESGQLVHNLAGTVELDESSRTRIVEAAEGNPLFVEEMLALLLESGGDGAAFELPPTIQALLAARLDRLPDDERAVIEAGAVEGKVFHESVVAEATGTTVADVQRALRALGRRELIRPEPSPLFSGERAHRFRHLLIRDAAYDSIPKEARTVLHERFADWLEQRSGARALEFEEILGYHLEQAFRYRSELGRVDETALDLALRAGRRLGVAGRRALARGDTPAAINLAARAASLLPRDDPLRVHVVPGVRTVQGHGDHLEWAEAVLSDAITTGDVRLQTHARVQQALLRLFTQSDVPVDEFVAVATDAIEVFEGLGDELGLARAWRLLQQARYLGRQGAKSADAAEQALVYARSADDLVEEEEILAWLGIALSMGSTPAAEATRRFESHLSNLRGSRTVEALLLACLATLEAMQGRFGEARELIDRAMPVVDELGYQSQLGAVTVHSGVVELLAGNPASAERTLRPALGQLELVGETSNYSSIVAVLARAVYDQGRYGEAEELTERSERAAHLNDVHAQITWRHVRAKTFARRGQLEDAEKLAEEAISYAEDSDFLNPYGDALLDHAEVLDLAGRPQDGIPAIQHAIRLFEQKGNVVSAAHAREVLDRLTATV
jgi:DNA-binding SARP family transcriptional activator/tetratricopeptide (TPR) repeat protein